MSGGEQISVKKDVPEKETVKQAVTKRMRGRRPGNGGNKRVEEQKKKGMIGKLDKWSHLKGRGGETRIGVWHVFSEGRITQTDPKTRRGTRRNTQGEVRSRLKLPEK